MRDAVMTALGTVQDPELHRDLVSLGMVERVEVEGDTARVKVNLTTPACPLKAKIDADVRAAVLAVPGIRHIDLEFGAQVRQPPRADLPGVKHIVLVGSGKGGVGKSSIAVNLAVALAQDGAKVGLLDGDVYGPSVAQMLGRPEDRVEGNDRRQMIPLEAYGVHFLSMANLAPPGQALVWRGPMLHSAIGQFLKEADWGELDYLVVDLPPGTGDVQLSISQTVKVTGALIVTTPQKVALIDAERAVDMFRKADIPVLGVVENMSYFTAPDGQTYDLFGRGGAQALNLPLLGEVPIDVDVRQDADQGAPAVVAHPDSPASRALVAVARRVAGRISVQTLAELPDQLPVV